MTIVDISAVPPADEVWAPKVGDKAVYTVHSVASRSLVNKRIVEIAKVTSAGYLHVKGDSTSKFQRAGATAFTDHRPKNYGARFYITRLEEPSDWEIANLPKTSAEGRDYAKRIRRESK